MQGDSTACDGLNPGVVLQHKQSGTELLIEGTKKSTETISLEKGRSLVQVIPTISAQAGKISEHRHDYSTAQSRTGGIELSSNSALHPYGEKGKESQEKVVRTITTHQDTQGPVITSVSVLL